MSNGVPAKAKTSGRIRKIYREFKGGAKEHSPCKFKRREGNA